MKEFEEHVIKRRTSEGFELFKFEQLLIRQSED